MHKEDAVYGLRVKAIRSEAFRGEGTIFDVKPDSKYMVGVAFDSDFTRTVSFPIEYLSKARFKSAYAAYDPKIHDLPLALDSYRLPLLETFCMDRGVMSFGCDPGTLKENCEFLKNHGIPNPEAFMRLGGKSHGLWINIDVPDPTMPAIDTELHLFFNPIRHGAYQLAKRAFTDRLLGHMVVLEPHERRADLSGTAA